MKRPLIIFAFLSLALVSCTNKSEPVIPAAVDEAVIIDIKSSEMFVGTTLQLTATVDPQSPKTVIAWISTDESVATVSSTGLVTAISSGTATIKAFSVASGSYDSCAINAIIHETDPGYVEGDIEDFK